jgi:hypothetical protein
MEVTYLFPRDLTDRNTSNTPGRQTSVQHEVGTEIMMGVEVGAGKCKRASVDIRDNSRTRKPLAIYDIRIHEDESCRVQRQKHMSDDFDDLAKIDQGHDHEDMT